jgi:hypothetical protein
MTMADLPEVGTRAVHKDDHAKQTGPVWKVRSVHPAEPRPIHVETPPHRLNKKYEEKDLTAEEFKDDYVQL